MDLLNARRTRLRGSESHSSLHNAKEEKYASLRAELMALRDARGGDRSSPSTPSSHSGWSPPGSAASLASTASSIASAQWGQKASQKQKRSSRERDDQFAKTWSTQGHHSSSSKLASKMTRSLSSGALLKASMSMLRLSPMKIERPLALTQPSGTLRLDSQTTNFVSKGIQGIALLDWKPQINVRVPRNSGMLGRLAKLKAMAIRAATQIQEQKFQLQMMRQSHQKAMTQGLEVDVNSFLPICDENVTTLAPTHEDVQEEGEVKDSPVDGEDEEVVPKLEVSFNIECRMEKWEPVSLSKGSIVFSKGKNELLETLCP